MKSYPNASAFRRALEDRLHSASKAEGSDLQRMRRQLAFDRLLVRLFRDGNPPWRLKGGYALELKLEVARTTRDLDLGLSLERVSKESLLEALQSAAAWNAGDYFTFSIGDSVMELEGSPYGGFRHPVEARIDGRKFVGFHLDLGVGDIQREPCEWTVPRDWLGFAGIDAGKFPSISREEHFAQKLHAYTLPREDRENTRVKDLIDMVLLIDAGTLDMKRLAADVRDTFRRRKAHPVPRKLESPPGFWKPVFERLAEECGIEKDMVSQFGKVAEFCGPLLGTDDGE